MGWTLGGGGKYVVVHNSIVIFGKSSCDGRCLLIIMLVNIQLEPKLQYSDNISVGGLEYMNQYSMCSYGGWSDLLWLH